MERVKNEGGDLTGVNWGERDPSSLNTPQEPKQAAETVKMTNDSVSRIIEIAEFLSHSSKECGAWFSVEGEVFPLTLVERSLFSLWGVPTARRSSKQSTARLQKT